MNVAKKLQNKFADVTKAGAVYETKQIISQLEYAAEHGQNSITTIIRFPKTIQILESVENGFKVSGPIQEENNWLNFDKKHIPKYCVSF